MPSCYCIRKSVLQQLCDINLIYEKPVMWHQYVTQTENVRKSDKRFMDAFCSDHWGFPAAAPLAADREAPAPDREGSESMKSSALKVNNRVFWNSTFSQTILMEPNQASALGLVWKCPKGFFDFNKVLGQFLSWRCLHCKFSLGPFSLSAQPWEGRVKIYDVKIFNTEMASHVCFSLKKVCTSFF